MWTQTRSGFPGEWGYLFFCDLDSVEECGGCAEESAVVSQDPWKGSLGGPAEDRRYFQGRGGSPRGALEVLEWGFEG